MAATLQKLKDQGWHLSEEGLKKLVLEDEPQVTDVKELAKRALDVDLKEISKGGGLAAELMKSSKFDVTGMGTVVQVTNVRNVSAPKANEESKTSPRMLQLDLTDGQNVCVALELEHIQCLSINTAPGTKLLLKGNIKMSHGMLMLGPSNVSVLGGLVPALFEKWEHNRVLAKYAKGIRPNAGPNGPPPWIPFGQKSVQQQTLSKDRTFKSLANETPEESKENAEFTAMRNEAISQAIKAKTRKVFGGGKRNLIDHNVKKIIDKGFTEEEAQMALKYARNNLERAMGNLKRDRAFAAGLPVPAAPEPAGRFGKGRERRGREEEPEGAKPSGKVSLFDFLTDKIPLVEAIPITSYNNKEAFSAPTRNTTAPAISRPIVNNFNSSSSGLVKRSDDQSNSYSQTKRFEDNSRRSDNNRRSDDGGPKGYKNEDGPTKKSISVKPSSHLDEPASSKSRAPRVENGLSHSARSAKPVINGNVSNDRGRSGSSSSAAQPTVSSKNPFSLENRAKFQNNVSTSFANRSKREDAVVDNGNRLPAKKDSKTGGNRQPATSENLKSRDAVKPSIESGRQTSQNSRKADVVEPTKPQTNATKSTKGGTSSSIEPPVLSKDNKRYENPFAKQNDRRGKTDQKPRSTPSPAIAQDTKVAQLIKATADLKVSEPPRPKPSEPSRPKQSKSTPSATSAPSSSTTYNNTQNHSTLTRSKTQPPKSLDQVFPNGFEFNPNKIMGFTNKETNEVAQSMLKAVASSGSNDMLTQLLGAASAASNKLAAQSSLSPLPEAFVPAAAVQPMIQSQPPPPVHNHVYAVRPVLSPQHHQQQPPPPQMPQQHYQPQIQHQPQFMTPINAQPQHMIGLQHFNWSLKLNDVCFAKYWEDGGYYHAEITGMSEKTCVVQFLEYGNFEEVLITDCVPITDENIQMINQFNAGLTLQPSHFQPQLIPQPQQSQPPPPHNNHPVPVAIHVSANPQYQTQSQPMMHQQPLLQTPQLPPHPHQHHQTSVHPYQPQPHPYNNQYNTQYQQQQQHLQRMRGERQMYVPPAQRSTK